MKQSIFLFVVAIIAFCTVVQGQISAGYPCVAIAKNNGVANILYGFSPEASLLDPIGATGTNQIAAMAINSNEGIIYAFEGSGGLNGANGALGIIDDASGNFVAIGTPGTGMGEFGAIALNNVKGMTYDNINNILYAVHRTDGEGNNDVLFKIDAATGLLIPNAMEDSNGNMTDYAVIEENSFQNVITWDVADIAISLDGNELYVLYSAIEGNIFAVTGQTLAKINTTNGNIEANLILVIDYVMESLGITSTGDLYALTNNNNIINPINIISLNPVANQYEDVGSINVPAFNFESFDCFVPATASCSLQLLVGPAIVTGLYKAKTIVAAEVAMDNIVASNSNVVFAAEEFVCLESIEVPISSDFLIEIKDCN